MAGGADGLLAVLGKALARGGAGGVFGHLDLRQDIRVGGKGNMGTHELVDDERATQHGIAVVGGDGARHHAGLEQESQALARVGPVYLTELLAADAVDAVKVRQGFVDERVRRRQRRAPAPSRFEDFILEKALRLLAHGRAERVRVCGIERRVAGQIRETIDG